VYSFSAQFIGCSSSWARALECSLGDGLRATPIAHSFFHLFHPVAHPAAHRPREGAHAVAGAVIRAMISHLAKYVPKHVIHDWNGGGSTRRSGRIRCWTGMNPIGVAVASGLLPE
jgi:hypothetical protein